MKALLTSWINESPVPNNDTILQYSLFGSIAGIPQQQPHKILQMLCSVRWHLIISTHYSAPEVCHTASQKYNRSGWGDSSFTFFKSWLGSNHCLHQTETVGQGVSWKQLGDQWFPSSYPSVKLKQVNCLCQGWYETNSKHWQLHNPWKTSSEMDSTFIDVSVSIIYCLSCVQAQFNKGLI